MSSANNDTTALTSGKDDFALSHLIAALEKNQGLVHIDVDPAFSKAPTDSSVVASDADWEKFWAAVAKINAPATALIESPNHVGGRRERISGEAVRTIVVTVIQIGKTLWDTFKNFDQKDVGLLLYFG